MKRILVFTLALALCVSVLAACAAPTAPAVQPAADTSAPVVTQQELNPSESTLKVSATETVKKAPDIAYVNMGVRSTGATAEEAQQSNATATEAFLSAIKGAGVQDDDIKTSYVNIYEDWETPGQYVMENNFSITVRNIDSVGEVIDAGTKAGANATYGLSFDIEDRDSVYIEALGQAMQAIGTKAQAVAESGGYKIVRPLSIEEGGSSSYYPMMDQPMAMESAAADAAAGVTTPVAPGDIEVSASVSGTYVIE